MGNYIPSDREIRRREEVEELMIGGCEKEGQTDKNREKRGRREAPNR